MAASLHDVAQLRAEILETVQKTEARLDEEILKKFLEVKDMVEKLKEDTDVTGTKRAPLSMKVKAAAHLLPKAWGGPKDRAWSRFSREIRNWAGATNPDMLRLLDQAEKLGSK